MSAGHVGGQWTLVTPVRDPRTGKSRLGASKELNAAIAFDTVSAALASLRVGQLVLVTDDVQWIPTDLSAHPRCQVILQTRGGAGRPGEASSLNAAVAEGLEWASRWGRGSARQAVMLGDLPALEPGALDLALDAALDVSYGMVSDHLLSGTTLLTACTAERHPHRPRFGASSARRHRDAGYTELPVPADSALRRDVDTPEDLQALTRVLGPASGRIVERSGQQESFQQKAEVL